MNNIRKQMEAFIYSYMVMPLSGADNELIRHLSVPRPTLESTRISTISLYHPRPKVVPLGDNTHNYERDRARSKAAEVSYILLGTNKGIAAVVGRFDKRHTTLVYRENVMYLFSNTDKQKGLMFADLLESTLFEYMHTDKVMAATPEQSEELLTVEYDQRYWEIFHG